MLLDILLNVLLFFAGAALGVIGGGICAGGSRADTDSEIYARDLKIMELEAELKHKDELLLKRGVKLNSEELLRKMR